MHPTIKKTLGRLSFIAGAVSVLSACGGGNTRGVLPTRVGAPPASDLTVVWVGYGESERLENGTWQHVPEFDYEFTVEQRRYPDRWESVKHMRRRHPAYDGSAGPREQILYFRVDIGRPDNTTVPLQITSTLGNGTGTSDREFRNSKLVLRADVSSFAPFDTYRIDQTYAYEQGELRELVSLDKGDKPWVRNKETATLFAPKSFPEPPTAVR